MEYLESNFAQIEHINQVIHNNLLHDSWECFDTMILLEQTHDSTGKSEFGYYSTTNPRNNSSIGINQTTNRRGKTVYGYHDIRYNSLLVSIEKRYTTTTEFYYEYTFEVRNTLWDGKYSITQSRTNADGSFKKFDKNDYTINVGYDEDDNTVSSSKDNIIKVKIKGDVGKSLRMCFHMTMADRAREIEVTTIQLGLKNEQEYTHQYDEQIYEKGTLSLSSGETPKNITIKIEPCDQTGKPLNLPSNTPKPGPYIPAASVSNNGTSFNMPYGPTSTPGTYYCLMSAESPKSNIKAPTRKIIKVNKIQNDSAKIKWGDDADYDKIYKGSIHTYRFGFTVFNQFGVESKNQSKIIGTPVNVTFIKTNGKREAQSTQVKYDSTKKEYYAEVTISYRKYYEDYSTLEVEISSDYGFGRIIDQRLIKHPWYVARNYNEIVNQLWLTNSNGQYVDTTGKVTSTPVANPKGTDWIFLECYTFDVDKPLIINRDITLASCTGRSRVFLDGHGHNIITLRGSISKQTQYQPINVNIIGLSFYNAECAINMEYGAKLLVDKCWFTGNRHEAKHHRGCSIYMPEDDESIKYQRNYRTEIRNSYFKNNKGNEIQSIGNTSIRGNVFITTDAQYLQQPEVKVVSVRAGQVKYVHNKSYINTGKKAMPSNHSYAKALAYVERGATFNGKGPNQLGGDMTLPLYGKYDNQAFTYAIYYYPYENVKTEIVCSPRKGYERKATGHSSPYKNWVYYDGYYFVRWNKGRNRGNTRNPWTEKELEIPSNLGIYHRIKDKFIDGYDPRLSGSKSLHMLKWSED